MLTPRGRALFRQLTSDDWLRIKAFTEAMTPHNQPAALEDLSVPLRVGACFVGDERLFSGERMGITHDGKIQILVWEMRESEEREWRDRRRRPT